MKISHKDLDSNICTLNIVTVVNSSTLYCASTHLEEVEESQWLSEVVVSLFVNRPFQCVASSFPEMDQ